LRIPSDLPVVPVYAGTEWHRIHPHRHDAIWFGPAPGSPPRNRFDAPSGEYRVFYAGESIEAAFVETVVRRPGWPRVVRRSFLEERRSTVVSVIRDLTLVQFHGVGLSLLGLDGEAAHRHPYTECQRVAVELWNHPARVDGIQYRSRWNTDLFCYALFDRAADALSGSASVQELGDLRVCRPLLRRYRVGVV
jgi:hypothetical protein